MIGQREQVVRIYELISMNERIAGRIERKGFKLKVKFHDLLRRLGDWEEGKKVRISPITARDVEVRDVNLKIKQKKQEIMMKIGYLKNRGNFHQAQNTASAINPQKFDCLEKSVQELQQKVKVMKLECINTWGYSHKNIPEPHNSSSIQNSDILFTFD